jgi:hypothetical protein
MNADTVDQLDDRDLAILGFEQQWWKFQGAKDHAIRERFDMTSVRYYQILNVLIDRPAALVADPMLVKRLRRLRAARAAQRTSPARGYAGDLG